MKKIILILLVLFLSYCLFSQETENKNDIRIGVSTTFGYFSVKRFSYVDIGEDNSLNTGGHPFGMGLGSGFALTYMYNLNPRISLGLFFGIGYYNTIYLPLSIVGINNIFSLRLLFRLKAGRENKKIKFLFETGLHSNIELPFQVDYRVNDYPDLFVQFGGFIYLGFENNKTSTSIDFLIYSGGLYGFTGYFNYYPQAFSINEINNTAIYNYCFEVVPIGFELRWMWKINK